MEEYRDSLEPFQYYAAFLKGYFGGFYMNPYFLGTRKYTLWEDEYHLGALAYKSLQEKVKSRRRSWNDK